MLIRHYEFEEDYEDGDCTNYFTMNYKVDVWELVDFLFEKKNWDIDNKEYKHYCECIKELDRMDLFDEMEEDFIEWLKEYSDTYQDRYKDKCVEDASRRSEW